MIELLDTITNDHARNTLSVISSLVVIYSNKEHIQYFSDKVKNFITTLKSTNLYDNFLQTINSSDLTEEEKTNKLISIINLHPDLINAFILVSEDAREPTASTVHTPISTVTFNPNE